ncbi:ABC transporter substrate-binding protein [Roseococcus sp. DSY-14]|uniref:ABC transporter substrate-binding protein n=1 Tax=Roseococcus sp. DSY-14 TaxID=3369650 RepID=UPI00387B41B1
MIPRRALPLLALAAPALAQAPAELRVGALFPPASLLGDEALRGVEMAVEEARPRPARLIRAEAADAAAALAEARRLVTQERVGVLFGSASAQAALAALQAAEPAEVPFVELVSAADSLPERASRALVRAGPGAAAHAALVADAFARALPQALGRPADAWRVAILHEAGPSAESLALAAEAALRGAGLAVADRVAHSARSAEMPALAARLRAAGVDAVLHAGNEADAASLLRALSEGGWRPPILLGLGAAWSLMEMARAPGIEGVLVADAPPIASAEAFAPGARPFAEVYQRRWGAAPRSGLSLAAMGAARAVLAAPGERGALRAALAALDLPEGALPNGWGWRLDERGLNARAAPVLAQWQGGRPVAVWPEAAAVAPLSRP